MSKTRTLSTLAAGLAILTACTLWAAPQTIADAVGVSVDTQGARLLHRSKVDYPREVQAQGVEGTVVAQLKLDTDGAVSDASILSGPDALRKPVLQSVLSWHFTKDAAGSVRQISVTFKSPELAVAPAASAAAQARLATLRSAALGLPSDATVTIQSIQLEGLGISDDEFLAKLPPLHVNQPVSQQEVSKFKEAVLQLDSHLSISTGSKPDSPGTMTLRITAPNVADVTRPAVNFPGAVAVGGRVQNAKLISHPNPVYPDLAKSAGISGTVSLGALIGTDGHMQQLVVISGHPLLRQAALDAVKTWTYEPTLLNGKPTPVSTTIDVVFSLNP